MPSFFIVIIISTTFDTAKVTNFFLAIYTGNTRPVYWAY